MTFPVIAYSIIPQWHLGVVMNDESQHEVPEHAAASQQLPASAGELFDPARLHGAAACTISLHCLPDCQQCSCVFIDEFC